MSFIGKLVVLAALVLPTLSCDGNFTNELLAHSENAQGHYKLLSSTGLYVKDSKAKKLSSGVIEYTVNYPLWSDGAKKARFISIPEGQLVNNSDPDKWIFPVGTKIWKEFADTSGKRIETRLMHKTIKGWKFATYIWNKQGNDANLILEGKKNAGVIDPMTGVTLDIPAINDCQTCHSIESTRPIGFDGFQVVNKVANSENIYNFKSKRKIFTNNLSPQLLASYRLESLGIRDRILAGYLHGNCSSCHNEHGDASFTDFYTRLNTKKLADAINPIEIYNKGGFFSIKDPSKSYIFQRIADGEMPPMGVKIPDQNFIEYILHN